MGIFENSELNLATEILKDYLKVIYTVSRIWKLELRRLVEKLMILEW